MPQVLGHDSQFTNGHYLFGLYSLDPRYGVSNVKIKAGTSMTRTQKRRDSFYLKSRKASQRRGYLDW